MVGTIDALLVRADQLTAQGRPHSAIAMLVPALREFPEYPAAWCRLAVAHLDAGEPGESLDAAKRAIVLGERSWAHRLASLALVELGRHDEAVVSAREAVRRDAADWRCHVTLAEALAHDTPLDAVRSARSAVALAPEEARTHEVLGDAATLAHDWLTAERSYRQAGLLDPDNEDVAAKLDRLVRRPPEDPRRPGRRLPRPSPTPRPRPPAGGRRSVGRAERVALLLVVRRIGVWQAVGALALLPAGHQPPSPMLAWYGLGVVIFVALLAWRGWRGLPPRARVSPRELSTREPWVAVSGVSAALSVAALLVWAGLLAIGVPLPGALMVAFGCGALAAANSWFRLWRIWAGRS